MNRKLGRVERALKFDADANIYERHANGMYIIPASEILPDESGNESSLVRKIYQLTMRWLLERFWKWKCEQEGLQYVPKWEMSREARARIREVECEIGRKHEEWVEGNGEAKARQAEYKKDEEARLERLHLVEKERGRPVAFLYPLSPGQVEQLYQGLRPFPPDDSGKISHYLTPIYADGTVGDRKHYPVSGPF